jgi:hypothetical protein
LACAAAIASAGSATGWSQAGPAAPAADAAASDPPAPSVFSAWEGKPVRSIAFEGVSAARLEPLPGQLAQQENAPFAAENVEKSLR